MLVISFGPEQPVIPRQIFQAQDSMICPGGRPVFRQAHPEIYNLPAFIFQVHNGQELMKPAQRQL